MSRIGIGYNAGTVDKRCLNCRRWRPADSQKGWIGEFHTIGHCSLGYCEKDLHNFNKGKRK